MKQPVPFSSIMSPWGLEQTNTNKQVSVYVCMVKRQPSVRDAQIRLRLPRTVASGALWSPKEPHLLLIRGLSSFKEAPADDWVWIGPLTLERAQLAAEGLRRKFATATTHKWVKKKILAGVPLSLTGALSPVARPWLRPLCTRYNCRFQFRGDLFFGDIF